MKISYDDIRLSGDVSAQAFARSIRKIKNPLSEEDVRLTQFPYILKTDKAKSVILMLIMGAIGEYHNQLRIKLLESDIDIGELDNDSTEGRDILSKIYGDE